MKVVRTIHENLPPTLPGVCGHDNYEAVTGKPFKQLNEKKWVIS